MTPAPACVRARAPSPSGLRSVPGLPSRSRSFREPGSCCLGRGVPLPCLVLGRFAAEQVSPTSPVTIGAPDAVEAALGKRGGPHLAPLSAWGREALAGWDRVKAEVACA